MRQLYSYATTMAILGAAVDPSTGIDDEGVTCQRLVSMIMGMLNYFFRALLGEF